MHSSEFMGVSHVLLRVALRASEAESAFNLQSPYSTPDLGVSKNQGNRIWIQKNMIPFARTPRFDLQLVETAIYVSLHSGSHSQLSIFPKAMVAAPKRPHKDLTFGFQGPIKGGYQKSWFVGSLCLCGLLGPISQVASQPARRIAQPGPVASRRL